MKNFAFIFLIALCGCMGPYARPVQSKVTPDLNPAHAVSSQSSVVSSQSNQAADTLAVVQSAPPIPPSFTFDTNNFENEVFCLQCSDDLVNWVNAEPNPLAPEYPVWHWGFGPDPVNINTNLPAYTGQTKFWRWKGMVV